VDREFLKVSLRYSINEHKEACLCKECRGRYFFDVVLENQELRQLIKDTKTKIFRVLGGENDPEAVINALYAILEQVDDITDAYLPDFAIRERFVDVRLEAAAVQSLLNDIPIEKEDPKPGEEHHLSNSRLFIEAGVGDWQDLSPYSEMLYTRLGLRPPKKALEDHMQVGKAQIEALKSQINHQSQKQTAPEPD
jgi:hypothetical protein